MYFINLNFIKFRKKILFFLFFLSFLFLIFWGNSLSLINNFNFSLYSLCNKLKFFLGNIFYFYKSVKNLKQENIYLKNKLKIFKLNNFYLSKLKFDNDQLKKYFFLSKNYEKKIFIARLIYSIIPFYNKIIINKGYNDGIYENYYVLNENGFIGKIDHVNKYYSSVNLICNLNSNYLVKILRNNFKFTLNSNGCFNNYAKIGNFPLNFNVVLGDIITLDDGGYLNYPIGIVNKIIYDKFFSLKIVEIFFFVKFNNLDYVFLVEK